jgi:16S rRNA (adenine1518-N6/adenine1519-N6)-dimethyltransferase
MDFPSQRIIQSLHIKPRKSLGQNFLIQEQVARKIVASCNLSSTDIVIEIGAGCGALTCLLAEIAGNVIAIELDKKLAGFLRDQLPARAPVTVVDADVLSLDFSSLLNNQGKAVLIGNIPYPITTPLFIKLLEEFDCIQYAVFMVQKEIRNRLTAQPGEDDYGLLSIYARAYLKVSFLCDVSAASFFPRPGVDSTVLLIEPVAGRTWSNPAEAFFREIATVALSHRRKTIFNCLKTCAAIWNIDESALKASLLRAGFDPVRRGETFSVQEFYHLSSIMFNMRQYPH